MSIFSTISKNDPLIFSNFTTFKLDYKLTEKKWQKSLCQHRLGNYQTNFTINLKIQRNKNNLGPGWIKTKIPEIFFRPDLNHILGYVTPPPQSRPNKTLITSNVRMYLGTA